MKEKIEVLIRKEQQRIKDAEYYLEKTNCQNTSHLMWKAKEEATAKIEAYKEVLTLIK